MCVSKGENWIGFIEKELHEELLFPFDGNAQLIAIYFQITKEERHKYKKY